MSILLVVYGYIQPYKSLTANIAEIVVQMNFSLLLILESTSFLRDAYNTFPSTSRLESGTSVQNESNTCSDDLTGVSILSAILLPFYYMPLLFFTVLVIIKLILFIR